MLDGLSTLYAADENNNKKAANEARKIAYMEGLADYEDLLYKPKEEKATASTLLYKPTEEKPKLKTLEYKPTGDLKQPELLSNNMGEPTREDFSSDRAYEEYTQHKSRTDPRRYVGETPTYMHEAPGTEYTAINKLNSGTEVIYTGNKVRDKNGEYWAEIECRGQRGWVVANDLRVTNPNPPKTKPASVEDETESVPVSSSGVTISTSQTQGIQEPEKTEYESGKVKDGPLNVRAELGTTTQVIGQLPKGSEVTYTGKMTEEKDGHIWAEVTYDGKTGWVATEYLEEIKYQQDDMSTEIPQEKDNLDENQTQIDLEEIQWIGNTLQLDGTSDQEKYIAQRLKNFTKLPWTQEKLDELWNVSKQIYQDYDIQIDPRLLLAIIIQEGTGSFNTSSINKAADGGNGVETNYTLDLMKANALIFGKLLGYIYYKDEFKKAVTNSGDYPGIDGEGNFFQYANWQTPKVDFKNNTVWSGVYAGHGAWHKGVKKIYEKLTDSEMCESYLSYLDSIDKNKLISILGDDIVFRDFEFVPIKNSQSSNGQEDGNYTIVAK